MNMSYTISREYAGCKDNSLGMARLTSELIGTGLFDEVNSTDDLLSATNHENGFTVLVDYRNANKEIVSLEANSTGKVMDVKVIDKTGKVPVESMQKIEQYNTQIKDIETITTGDGKNTHNIKIICEDQTGIEVGRVLTQVYKEFGFSEQK